MIEKNNKNNFSVEVTCSNTSAIKVGSHWNSLKYNWINVPASNLCNWSETQQ